MPRGEAREPLSRHRDRRFRGRNPNERPFSPTDSRFFKPPGRVWTDLDCSNNFDADFYSGECADFRYDNVDEQPCDVQFFDSEFDVQCVANYRDHLGAFGWTGAC
jgi:hypothetical protein